MPSTLLARLLAPVAAAALLVPLAASEDPRVVEILERYRAGVSDPAGPSQR